MPIDTDTAYSPGWWLKELAKKLAERRNGPTYAYGTYEDKKGPIRPGIDLLDRYYRGDPPLTQVANEWADFARAFIRKGRLNVADLVVASPANRLQLRDFRTSAADDEFGDKKVRELMRLNGMKTKIRDVHELTLAHADGYAMATPPDDFRDFPLMTSESGQQVITAHDTATGYMLAGLKLFRDDWEAADWGFVFHYDEYNQGFGVGQPRLTVFRKNGLSTIRADAPFRMNPKMWQVDEDRSRALEGDTIPIFRWTNRKGIGEFEEHLGSLDRINDKIANEWWLIKTQAFRQRAAKGLPDADADGNPYTPEDWQKIFVADPGALWTLPEGVEFWESEIADIRPVTEAIREDLERLAAVMQVALHTLIPDSKNQSAQGSTHKKEENTFKIEDRRDRFETEWCRLISVMLSYWDAEAKARANVNEIEPIWGPIERYSLQEKSEASAKAKGVLPDEIIWRDVWQYAPADIAELRKLKARELLLNTPVPNPGQNPLATQRFEPVNGNRPPTNGNRPPAREPAAQGT